MSDQSIQNEAPAHKYFTLMLNMADDDLDPFEYRLLAHYVRVCGGGGVCNESIRTTAKITQMGVNKVQTARDNLAQKGYLNVKKPTQEDARKGETCEITIIDRWAENIARYSKGVSNQIQVNSQAVSNEIQVGVSNQIHKKNKEEELKDSASDDAPPKKSTAKKTRQPNPVFDLVALHSFGIADASQVNGQGGRVGKIVGYLSKQTATPEQIAAFYKWYAAENPGVNAPRDVGKFEEHWLAWRQTPPPIAPTVPKDPPPFVPAKPNTDRTIFNLVTPPFGKIGMYSQLVKRKPADSPLTDAEWITQLEQGKVVLS